MASNDATPGRPRPTGSYMCMCGVDCMLLKSRTAANPDRWFFKCTKGCGTFKWADELPGYPNIGQLQHTPTHPGQRMQQQQQQQRQQQPSPSGLPRYHEAAAAPAGYGSPVRQGPAFGAGSGGGGGYATPPRSAQGPAWQQQSPMQQQQQQGPSWQQQSPMQQQYPSSSGWQQPAPTHSPLQPPQQQQQQAFYPAVPPIGVASPAGPLPPLQQQQQQCQPSPALPWGSPVPGPNQQQQLMLSQGSQGGAGPGSQGGGGYGSQQQQQPFDTSQLQQQQGSQPGGGAGPAAAAAAAAAPPAPSPNASVVVRLLPTPGDESKVDVKVPYNEAFLATFKMIPSSETGRIWDRERKTWTVHEYAAALVRSHLRRHGFTVLDGNEATPGKHAAANLLALEASDARLLPLGTQQEAEQLVSARIPQATWEQLLPHQREGVLAGVRRGGRLLIADEMGLGKTAQAIIVACCFPGDWPLLVVAPSSLLTTWLVELQAWTGLPRDAVLLARDGQQLQALLEGGGARPARHVLVASYDLLRRLPAHAAAAAGRYGVVIADESHALKNREAQRTRSVGALVRGARRALLLTGTPLLSRPIEAWSQVDMLRPGLLGSYEQYGERYCINQQQQQGGPSPSQRAWPGQQYQGANAARAEELHRLLAANVMVRRTKAAVGGLALPDKTRMRVVVPLSAEATPGLDAIRAEMAAVSAAGQDGSLEAKQLINRYRLETGAAKVAGVLEFVRGLPALAPAVQDEEPRARGGGGGGGKLLVFAYHHAVLDALEAGLAGWGAGSTVRIDGTTGAAARAAAVSALQGDGDVRVALLAIKAAGTGLTLTAADTVVFVELHWNPTDLAQCEDRIHRLGQSRHCSVYYCVAPDSADDLMWGSLLRKLRVVGAAVDGGAGGASADGLRQAALWSRLLEQHEGEPQLAPGGDRAALPAPGGGAGAPAGSSEQRGGGSQSGGAAPTGSGGSGSGGQQQQQGASRGRRSLLDAFDAVHDAPAADGSAAANRSSGGSQAATLVGEAAGSAPGSAGDAAAAAGAAAGGAAGSGSGSSEQERAASGSRPLAVVAAADGGDGDSQPGRQRLPTQGSQARASAAAGGDGSAANALQQEQEQAAKRQRKA